MSVKLKIDNKLYEIPSLSELSFNEFNKLIVKAEAFKLEEYLSVYTGIPLNELMKSKVTGYNLTVVHNSIYNVNVNEVIKTKKEVLDTHRRENRYILTSDLSLEKFGDMWHYDLKRSMHDMKQINTFELCMYAIAIATVNEGDDYEAYYNELGKLNWMKVLPHGFFLSKKIESGLLNSIKLFLAFTLVLNRIDWKIQGLLNKLKEEQLIAR